LYLLPSGQQFLYKIDEYRTWNTSSGGYYNLQAAGVYHYRLRVRYPGEWNWVDWSQPTESDLLLPRSIYMTIQPNVQVYREIAGSEEKIYLVKTAETLITANPLVKNIQISVANDSTTLATNSMNRRVCTDFPSVA